MFENLNHTLYTFLISMLPIVELRGAIPIGCGFGLPFWENYLVCTLGNLLPVPFILLFIRFILNWMKGVPHLDKIANWVENKAHKHSASIVKYAGWGLFIFVAIPLPGTGAWTGALIAAMLDMRMRKALPAITAGVLTAGLIVAGVSYGFLNFLKFMF